MKAKLRWNGKPKSIINRKVLKNNGTALFMATTWHRLYNPFVPMDTGFLANDSVSVWAEGGRGYIRHGAPYAVFVYHGHHMAMGTSRHPLASMKWDDAAYRAGRHTVLLNDARAYVGRGG